MTAPFRAWLADPLAPAVERSLDRLRSAGDVVRVAAMPDVHLAEEVCVGVVVATTHRIYPAAVGGDDGEPGIIPGSMGTWSFHTRGRGHPESLGSSSHGAGRTMSRSEARGRIRVRDLERETGGVWFDHRLARRLVEEAPGAYRDIGRVMRAQRDLTRVVRRLRPVLVHKGA